MRRIVFWFLAAAVLAAASHLAYMLFVPSRNFNAALDKALGTAKANSFVILDSAAQESLIPFTTGTHVVGICKYDLSKGAVRVALSVPEGLWSFAIYTVRGRQVYAINDTQADTNAFTVELQSAEGIISQVFSGGEDTAEVVNNDLGWRVKLEGKRGLAVIWIAQSDPLLRAEAEAVLRKSKCSLAD
jgi:uncharacterized membrane protein